MKAHGWELYGVNDGEGFIATNSEKFAMEQGFAVDEFKFYFKKEGEVQSVFFVLGNSGWDVICDHSCAIDEFNQLMEKVSEYALKFE